MAPRKQILTWRCGPCDRWVAIDVELGVTPRCPTCRTEKSGPRPNLDRLPDFASGPWGRPGTA
jgi:hypothetical protein